MRAGFRLILASWLLSVTSARAEAGRLPLELTWEAPKECPSAADIRAELARIAHVRPGRSVPPLQARGRIETIGGGYRLVLRTNRAGEMGERKLRADECRSLAREVTLVLAVAFGEGVEIVDQESASDADAERASAAPSEDTESEAEVAALPSEPSPTTREPSSAGDAVSEVPAPRRPRRTSARIELFAGAGALVGALPAPALVVSAGAQLGSPRLWFRPRVSWVPHVNDALEHGVEARYDGFGGALAGCFGTPIASLLTNACLGGAAWALRGRSWGATDSGSAVAPWYAGTADIGVSWPARARMRLGLEAGLAVSLEKPRFVIEGFGEAHAIPRLAPHLALALIVAL